MFRRALLFFFFFEVYDNLFIENLMDFIYLFPFIFISWRLIAVQYCSGFCHTLT